MHISVSKLTVIGSDNGLSPGRREAIIWTNDWILLIGPLGTNFGEFFYRNSYIQENAFENVVQKMVAILSQPQWVNTSIHSHIGIKNPGQPLCYQEINAPLVLFPHPVVSQAPQAACHPNLRPAQLDRDFWNKRCMMTLFCNMWVCLR